MKKTDVNVCNRFEGAVALNVYIFKIVWVFFPVTVIKPYNQLLDEQKLCQFEMAMSYRF